MNWDNYEVEGQLSLFDLLETEDKPFNPIEALALHGTGFVDGMKRVKTYFLKTTSMSKKADFLKNEYGLGGFSHPQKKACYVCRAETNAKGITYSYFDETLTGIETFCSWEQLAKVITYMLQKGIYKEK